MTKSNDSQDSGSGLDYHGFQVHADLLFRHFLELRRVELPKELLQRFYWLFVNGVEYPEPEVLNALYEIASSEWARQEFSNILNRCCYILVNYWWAESSPNYEWATIDLVASIKKLPNVPANSIYVQRLRELVQQFQKTPQYESLQRRAQTAAKPSHAVTESKVQTLSEADSVFGEIRTEQIRHLIHRYPCLYPHYLLDYDSDPLGCKAVRTLQVKRERQFDCELWQYVNQLIPASKSSHLGWQNPTLMREPTLKKNIWQFTSKVEGSQTYYGSAQQFLQDVANVKTYISLKQHLYEYITTSLCYSPHPSYGKHRFNDWLSGQLRDIFPQSDHVKPNGFLLVNTCDQLLAILVADPKIYAERHYQFIDLHNNIGATWLIGLILKLILLCRQTNKNLELIKYRVAERFAAIFRHHERAVLCEIEWLAECLDSLMISFTIHFGQRHLCDWTNLLEDMCSPLE